MAEAKLTNPQSEFLRDLARRGPQRVAAGYKPAARLSELGLAAIEVVGGGYGWRLTITPAGTERAKATP